MLRALAQSASTIMLRYRGRGERRRYQMASKMQGYRAISPPPTDAELERLQTTDRWSALMLVLAPALGSRHAALIVQACDEYVIALLRSQEPHTLDALRAYLDQAHAVASGQ